MDSPDITIGNLEAEGLPNVQRINLVEGAGQDRTDLYFDRQAFHTMAKHLGVTSATGNGFKETAGVFFGTHGTTNGKTWTRIDHYFPLADNLINRAGGDVTFTPQSQAEAIRFIDQQYPNENYVIEGTAHSHPNFGTFLSQQDKEITEAWPYEQNFAVVYDPVRGELAVFSPGGGAQADDKQKKVVWQSGLKVTDETVKEVTAGGRSPQELGIGNYKLNRGYYLFGADPLSPNSPNTPNIPNSPNQ